MPGGVTLQFVARDASKRGGGGGAAAGAGSTTSCSVLALVALAALRLFSSCLLALVLSYTSIRRSDHQTIYLSIAGGEPTELLTAVSTTAFAARVLEMHGADPDAAAAAATQHMAEVV